VAIDGATVSDVTPYANVAGVSAGGIWAVLSGDRGVHTAGGRDGHRRWHAPLDEHYRLARQQFYQSGDHEVNHRSTTASILWRDVVVQVEGVVGIPRPLECRESDELRVAVDGSALLGS